MEIANSHFPLTCLKCDNRVSGASFERHKDKTWGAGAESTAPAFFPPLWRWREQNDLQVAPSEAKRNATIWKRALPIFFNCKRKKENEKKMLIVAARKYAWENGLYHLFFEVGVEKEMKPGREDPEG